MKLRFFVKLLCGLLLIAALAFAAYKLLDGISVLIIDALSGTNLPDNGHETEMVTPEPMPTMPDYMTDDSFYDSAGSVDIGDE